MANASFTEKDILLILLQHQGGIKSDDLCREYGLTSETLNEWLEKYGTVSNEDVQAVKTNDKECEKMRNFIRRLQFVYHKYDN